MNASLSRAVLAAVVLLVAVACVFKPLTGYNFVAYDDDIHVTKNERLAVPGWSGAAYFWRSPHEKLYIPLSYTLWLVQAKIAHLKDGTGYDPRPFHTTNLVLHAASSVLVLLLLRRLSGSLAGALLGALLFAVHPVQVETVAWVSEFKGVLAGFFCLLAAWLHIASVDRQGGKGSLSLDLAGLAAFALALLSKPDAAALPLMLAAIDRYGLGRTWRDTMWSLLPWAAAVLPVAAVSIFSQPGKELAYIPPVILRPVVFLDALAFYLGKLVWPTNLAVDYGRLPFLVLHSWRAYVTWLAPAAVAAVLWAFRRRLSFLHLPAALFVLGLLPVSGLVPFHFQTFSTVADRYLYLPMLGPALGLALLPSKVGDKERKWIAYGVSVAALVVLAVLAGRQVRVWQNSFSLFERALAVNPNSFSLQLNFGAELADMGRFEEAIAHYKEAIRALPTFAEAYFDMGNAQAALGRHQEALANYERAVALRPSLYVAYFCLAKEYNGLKQFDRAAAAGERALRTKPDFAEAHFELGVALSGLGRDEEALAHFLAAARFDPKNDSARINAGAIMAKGGRYAEAAGLFQDALRIRPNYPEVRVNLGRTLEAMGMLREAAAQYGEALRERPAMAEARAALETVSARLNAPQ